MSKQSLIAGTLVLTIASLITRLLGFGFRIYQSQVMGAEGMGLYQLLFPIYMLIWAASSAGIALAISKMVAAEVAKGEEGNAIRIVKVALLIALPLSLFLSFSLYSFAPFIAKYYIHEPITELSLRLLALCVPFMSVACCLRGYFQGHQEMSITALAQIIEQIARMAAIYLLASFMVPLGLKYICALGVIGMCAGEVFSFIMSFIAFSMKKKRIKSKITPANLPKRSTLKKLLSLSIPITANRFLTSGLQSFENILIPLNLQKFGLSTSAALGLYGEFSGMAMPLLFFPSMVTSSLATALVPAISEAVAMKQTALLQKTISTAIQFSCLIGIGATALFLSFPYDIAIICYKLPEVGTLLKWLAIICPFLYLQNILTGTMNGLGMQKQTFKVNIIGSLVCIAIITILVPKRGIIGFVLAMLLQSGFVCCTLLSYITEQVDLPVKLTAWLIKPALSGLFSSFLSVKLYYVLLHCLSSNALALILALLVFANLYLMFLFISGCLSIHQIKTFLASTK